MIEGLREWQRGRGKSRKRKGRGGGASNLDLYEKWVCLRITNSASASFGNRSNFFPHTTERKKILVKKALFPDVEPAKSHKKGEGRSGADPQGADQPPCPASAATSCPLLRSHTRATRSIPPDTSRLQSRMGRAGGGGEGGGHHIQILEGRKTTWSGGCR